MALIQWKACPFKIIDRKITGVQSWIRYGSIFLWQSCFWFHIKQSGGWAQKLGRKDEKKTLIWVLDHNSTCKYLGKQSVFPWKYIKRDFLCHIRTKSMKIFIFNVHLNENLRCYVFWNNLLFWSSQSLVNVIKKQTSSSPPSASLSLATPLLSKISTRERAVCSKLDVISWHMWQ